jgi:hypothetical protein
VYIADKKGNVLMTRCKTLAVGVCLLGLAAVPALVLTQNALAQNDLAQNVQAQNQNQPQNQAPGQTQSQRQTPASPTQTQPESPSENPAPEQNEIPTSIPRGNLELNFGETADTFGGLSTVRGFVGDINGQMAVYQSPDQSRGTNIVVGGEIRFPTDTQNHATEFAVLVGPEFHFGSRLTVGVHGTIRKLLVPPSDVDGVIFNRSNMWLLELPVVAQYKFGAAKRTFLQVEATPEFSPRFTASNSQNRNPGPTPNLDHGYSAQGSLGYSFGKWYVKGTYQARFFKFNAGDIGNPNGLYNWRTNVVFGGVGITF